MSFLVFWGGSCQDLETKGDIGAFLWVKGMEHGTLHDDTSSSMDTEWQLSCENVVTSAHLDCNSRV